MKTRNFIGTCDCCGEFKYIQAYENVPMIFMSEQTGGAPVKPYISLENMFLCPKCRTALKKQAHRLQELSEIRFITASGAMGSNSVFFDESLFLRFKIDEDVVLFKPVESGDLKKHNKWRKFELPKFIKEMSQ